MSNLFRTHQLGEVAEIIAGGDKPKVFSLEKKASIRVPVLANAEKNNGLMGYTDNARIFEPAVTIAARGSNVGFVAVRKEPFFPVVRLLSLIPKKEHLDVDYLYYDLKQNRKKGTGSGQPQITIPDISCKTISLPPISIQKKVAEVLSILDKKIELNNRINAELEAIAKTLYEYWFVQFDFPDANGKPYKTSGGKMVYNSTLRREIPEGWELVPIEYFADVIDPHPSHRAPTEVESGFPFAGIGDIDEAGNISISKARQIDEEFVLKQEKDYEIGEYSIGYGRVGTVGKVVRLKKQKFRYALSPTLSVINPKKPEYAGYVYTVIKSDEFYKQVIKNTSGTTRPAVGIQLLRKIPVLKPGSTHKNMFEKYEEITKGLFEKSSIVNQENQNLIELRDWLLPMLMNGQVTVK
ncbi:restriction endonuclease subunit S [Alishewanella sp. BS5-314]|uniref:restriction endonuclease subunit S n=1 Tax=Alishewanella sp. BS5-314 TaxID=2755587 RepID=UPI0021BB4997|nr:restriction endonuclease subunit S [Alishewanella sp. BS5-314]MCT8126085.1 restriction endonuclease subunit S [Alishewanella sp. BS5-314]